MHRYPVNDGIQEVTFHTTVYISRSRPRTEIDRISNRETPINPVLKNTSRRFCTQARSQESTVHCPGQSAPTVELRVQEAQGGVHETEKVVWSRGASASVLARHWAALKSPTEVPPSTEAGYKREAASSVRAYPWPHPRRSARRGLERAIHLQFITLRQATPQGRTKEKQTETEKRTNT